MVDTVIIKKIINGYTLDQSWPSIDSRHTIFCKDWVDIIKHLDTCYGKVDKEMRDYYTAKETKK